MEKWPTANRTLTSPLIFSTRKIWFTSVYPLYIFRWNDLRNDFLHHRHGPRRFMLLQQISLSSNHSHFINASFYWLPSSFFPLFQLVFTRLYLCKWHVIQLITYSSYSYFSFNEFQFHFLGCGLTKNFQNIKRYKDVYLWKFDCFK